jgi:hypothetical protein
MISSTLKMVAEVYSEILVTVYQTTHCNVPEDSTHARTHTYQVKRCTLHNATCPNRDITQYINDKVSTECSITKYECKCLNSRQYKRLQS